MSKWSFYANKIRTLRSRLGFDKNSLEFLLYNVNLESGRVFDKLENKYVVNPETIYVLLSHYAKADLTPKVGKLIRFRDLPGGYAYEKAFTKRAVIPIAEIFGSEPKMLVEAAKPLNGIEAKYGDSSVALPALPMIPITYVVWKGDDEFPASSTVLFDISASHYLPTEDISVLGEITTSRLKSSMELLFSTWHFLELLF